MAYGNFGAYVWKNGKDITKDTCDRNYFWENNKWNLKPKENFEDEHELEVYSHAVIPLDDNIILEFYKLHILNIYIKNKEHCVDIENEIFNKAKCVYKDIIITGCYLNDAEYIVRYDINYKGDNYCVVIGSCFGNGYDETHISKYIKANVKYVEEFNGYFIDYKSDNEIEYYIRKDNRRDQRYNIWHWGIKPFFKDLFTFKWCYLGYDLIEIWEKLIDLYYLR